MTLTPTAPLSQIQFTDEEQKWLESRGLSHATSHDRNGAHQLLNSEKIGIPYKLSAVRRAFDDGSIPTAFVSGRALASPYDIVLWALSRKYTSRGTNRKASA